MNGTSDILFEQAVKLYLRVYNYVRSHKRRVVIICAVLAVIYTITHIWSNYALVEIIVTQPKDTPKAEVFTSEPYNSTSIGDQGIHLLSRQTNSILVRAGANIRTQSIVDIPWYAFFVTKHIDLQYDKNAEKIAYRSTLDSPCGVYSEKQHQMLQYSCGNTNALVRYDTPDIGAWSITSVADNLYYPDGAPISYMGGIIGISSVTNSDYSPPGNIIATSDTGKIRYLSSPDQIGSSMLNQATLYTDETNQGNNRFVVVAQSGAIYLGTPKPDPNDPGVVYREILPPAYYNPDTQQTMCNLYQTTVTCYRGLMMDDGNISKESNGGKNEVVKLSFDNNNMTTLPVDDVSALLDFVRTNDGQLYGLSQNQLVYFEQKGSRYQAKELSRNAGSIIGGDKLYFIQDNGIFAIDPKTHDSHQVFYSNNILPQRLITANNKLFFIGKSVNSDMYSYAWQLNNESDLNYGSRYIDLLPSFPDTTAYGDVDLVGNTIQIDTRQDPTMTTAQQRQATLDYLKLMGIDTSKLTVHSP